MGGELKPRSCQIQRPFVRKVLVHVQGAKRPVWQESEQGKAGDHSKVGNGPVSDLDFESIAYLKHTPDHVIPLQKCINCFSWNLKAQSLTGTLPTLLWSPALSCLRQKQYGAMSQDLEDSFPALLCDQEIDAYCVKPSRH